MAKNGLRNIAVFGKSIENPKSKVDVKNFWPLENNA